MYVRTYSQTSLAQNSMGNFKTLWATSKLYGQLQNSMGNFKLYGQLQNFIGNFKTLWATSNLYGQLQTLWATSNSMGNFKLYGQLQTLWATSKLYGQLQNFMGNFKTLWATSKLYRQLQNVMLAVFCVNSACSVCVHISGGCADITKFQAKGYIRTYVFVQSYSMLRSCTHTLIYRIYIQTHTTQKTHQQLVTHLFVERVWEQADHNGQPL